MGGGTAHCDQPRGILLRGGLQHAVHRTFFHLFAMAQDLDTVRDLCHHGQVVRDVKRGGTELADQRLDQDQHFDLGGDVQRGRGFVEHQNVRAAGHGHGRHRALQLTAGGLVRVTFAEVLGVGQIQRLEQAARPGFGLGAGHEFVQHWRLADLVHDAVRRVECGGSGLRHIGNAPAAYGAPAFGIQGAQIHTIDLDGATGNMHPGAGVTHSR